MRQILNSPLIVLLNAAILMGVFIPMFYVCFLMNGYEYSGNILNLNNWHIHEMLFGFGFFVILSFRLLERKLDVSLLEYGSSYINITWVFLAFLFLVERFLWASQINEAFVIPVKLFSITISFFALFHSYNESKALNFSRSSLMLMDLPLIVGQILFLFRLDHFITNEISYTQFVIFYLYHYFKIIFLYYFLMKYFPMVRSLFLRDISIAFRLGTLLIMNLILLLVSYLACKYLNFAKVLLVTEFLFFIWLFKKHFILSIKNSFFIKTTIFVWALIFLLFFIDWLVLNNIITTSGKPNIHLLMMGVMTLLFVIQVMEYLCSHYGLDLVFKPSAWINVIIACLILGFLYRVFYPLFQVPIFSLHLHSAMGIWTLGLLMLFIFINHKMFRSSGSGSNEILINLKGL